MNAISRLATAISLVSLLPLAAHAGEVEVLHWWTSGGEKRAADTLQKLVEDKGHSWKDFAVAGGGGGEAAITVLKTRAVSGNPPAAAQIKGPDIQEWGELGLLADLNQVAEQNGWGKLLPPQVIEVMQFGGDYVAVPVNVHRVNWLWINPEVFAKAGATPPTTLDEFFAAADKLQAAGKDYQCLPFPGTKGSFAYNIDSLAMFKLSNAENRKAQQDLARTVMEPEFQEFFNQNKGSIPVRTDMDMSAFDACAQASMKDFKEAAANGGLQPSLAHGMAASSYVQGAVFDVVTNFFNDAKADPQKAAQQLAEAIQAVQ